MANDIGIEAIYVGERLNMIAECSAFDPCSIGMTTREAKYLVTPIGTHDYDTGWYSNRADAIADAKELARVYGVPVRGV